ncbi:transaldolase family protein [Sphaerisporangium sp. TRM90804]|uniref:transaldolase family protein n=1 Tax=Sphaerisporangium sp. TRM90804 TaxID=3031113 RepID=UPI00244CFE2D|nr:transaldolase family protein [Sphaerisporangium sp. TRM90804]MDH2426543.1 transaldolase family protein [Sphaerisporangium sp. TRM90804]
MTVYVDSADRKEIRAAAQLGFVTGVTTNPSLMRTVTDDPLQHAKQLLADEAPAEFYYQPTGAYAGLREEAESAWSLAPDRVIVKVPATTAGAALAKSLTSRGVPVALTAAQTPNAMIVAEAVGCVAVIPYVDRAWRDPRVDSELVAGLARVRRGTTRIVAASVKNAGQFTKAFTDGADAVTAPLDVLAQVLNHPAALEAERDFAERYAGGA